jgi:hypothetical protein
MIASFACACAIPSTWSLKPIARQGDCQRARQGPAHRRHRSRRRSHRHQPKWAMPSSPNWTPDSPQPGFLMHYCPTDVLFAPHKALLRSTSQVPINSQTPLGWPCHCFQRLETFMQFVSLLLIQMAERPTPFENVFDDAGNQLCDFRDSGDFDTPDHWLEMCELVSNYLVKAGQPIQFGITDLDTGAVAPVTCRVGLSHCLKQIRKAHQKGFRLLRVRVDALVLKVL